VAFFDLAQRGTGENLGPCVVQGIARSMTQRVTDSNSVRKFTYGEGKDRSVFPFLFKLGLIAAP
jgi:hypothetical protein